MAETSDIQENRRKVRDLIASLPPEKFDMRRISTGGCGSPACIKGWAETLMQPLPNEWEVFLSEDVGRWMGLTDAQKELLFFPLEDELGDGRCVYEATPTDAVAVLDHLIATGKVDWSVASRVEA